MTQFPQVDLRQQTTYRLVSTGRLQEVLGYSDLEAKLDLEPPAAAGFAEQALHGIKELEENASPTPRFKHVMDDLLSQSQIRELLRYAPSEGHRFSRQHQLTWYCGFPPDTSVEEVAHHKLDDLQRANCLVDTSECHELVSELSGTFCDLRLKPGEAVSLELHPDPWIAYPRGQDFADEVRRAGFDGIIYGSVRHPTGTCVAVFDPGIVGPVRLGKTWTLSWHGDPQHTAVSTKEPPPWLTLRG